VPVIGLDLGRLCAALGKPADVILDALPYLGLDIEAVERDEVRVEYSPNRPDYGSEIGILRALKGFLGVETGTPMYHVAEGTTAILVEEGVRTVRPFIVGMVARGVRLDEGSIKQLISLQEDLHNGVGRRRRVASIGLHDFRSLRPPVRYTVVHASFRFIPLGASRPMTVESILRETEQGRRYGHIVSGLGKYPILVDSVGNVLSMPPVINGAVTVVTEKTDTLFVDVTGTSLAASEACLNILACHLADMGARIESVSIEDGSKTLKTPRLVTTQVPADVSYIQRLLGIRLRPEDLVSCLARSRLTAVVHDGRVVVEVPCYRVDIIHPVDIAEEVALGYHIARFKPTLPRFRGAGIRNPRVKFQHLVRMTMVGLAYTEVITPTLVDSGMVMSRALRVEEPKSSEHEYLRDGLTSGILRTLSRNRHEAYPQRIFEVGRVFRRDGRMVLGVREEVHLAAATAHAEAGFTEIRSTLEALFKSRLGVELELRPASTGPFAAGRCARVVHGSTLGYVGEVSPKVLVELGLQVPVALFEVNLEPFLPAPQF
jgi:phenylalanyl-tRNA synthetase beta chain